ncbi:hypothetical protein CIK87_05785 [Prevotella sp. P5-64]|nr:hypothetical protein CIK87_05785 [Prevotella sp. P5-64]
MKNIVITWYRNGSKNKSTIIEAKKFAADNKPSYLCDVKTLETATGVETEDNKWREPKRKTT